MLLVGAALFGVWKWESERQANAIERHERAIAQILVKESPVEGDQEAFEEHAEALTRLDPDLGAAARQKGRRRQVEWELLKQLSKEDRALILRLLTPYSQSGSLYFLLEPAERVRELERVVRIQALLASPGLSPVAPKHELMRAQMAVGELKAAELLADDLLARQDLSVSWRLAIVRDWVWLLITLNEPPERLNNAVRRLEGWWTAARTAVTKEGLGLLVGRAQLHIALQEWGRAAEDLNEYFEVPPAARAFDVLEWGGPDGDRLADNTPALLYLDACLLQGFLLDRGNKRTEATAAWEKGFLTARGTALWTAYEAAVLGSLSGRLDEDDAKAMVQNTVERSKIQGKGEYLKLLELVFKISPRFVTTVLRDSWAIGQGRAATRRLAYRQMPFGEFVRAQIVRWVASGLRYGVGGWRPDGRVSDLTEGEERLIEDLAHRAVTASLDGSLPKRHLGTLAQAAGPSDRFLMRDPRGIGWCK
jgi:hypothetical protein